MKNSFYIFLSIFFVSGCSLLPYESASSCNMKKQYGKCIDVEGAYEEAVTGVDSGAPDLYKLSEGKGNETKKHSSTKSIDKALSISKEYNESTYLDYQSKKYKELASLISEPNTPMISPAKTVRTLIISYSPRYDGKTLYMPRYIFSIVEPSKFVLGQSMENKENIENIFTQ